MANAAAAINLLPDDWDFRGADTKAFTHCFHSYPAMMIPQIAGRLIDEYGHGAQMLFDPYCGTGTSLVEANLRGVNATGGDLNPLARLISCAKTEKPSIAKIDSWIRYMHENLLPGVFSKKSKINLSDELPEFDNIDFWFSKSVQNDLAKIKFHINQIENNVGRHFFLVAFSETVRESSYTRNDEFKMYRMPELRRQNFHPNVFALFVKKLQRNRNGLAKFIKQTDSKVRSQVFDFNSVIEIPHKIIATQSADLVVTSPPYGDSSTTVAYGQFSRLSNEWLGFDKAVSVDRNLMGGKKLSAVTSFDEPKLDGAIAKIAEQNLNRALEVCAFYRDYQDSIKNVATTIKLGGYACYVVGNRKVKGVVLPTDVATEFFFKQNGFTLENVFMRNIPNKRMPSRNSPSNVAGNSDATMCHEHIVVMRKDNESH